VCLVAGITAGRLANIGRREAILTACAFAVLAAASHAARSQRLRLTCVLAAVFFAGGWIEAARKPGPPPLIERQAREVLLVEGCVVEPPVFYQDRQRFVVEIEPGARARLAVYPRPGETLQPLAYGQRIEVAARLRPARNFNNPGAFDYAGYLARRQTYWTGTVPAGERVQVLPGRCGSALGRFVYWLRGEALDRIERLYAGRTYETAMMQALLVGEAAKTEESWLEPFRVTGSYHALVISGSHLAVLAAAVIFLLRWLPLGELTPHAVAAFLGWLYALVTGWQSPVVRAAAALTLLVVARHFYRRPRTLNLLAAAAIVFLALDPGQLFEASFQLSFLCIVAIAALAAPLLERTSAPYVYGLAALADRDRDLRLPPPVAQFRVELRLLAETVGLWTPLPERLVLAAEALLLRGVFYLFELAAVSASIQIGLALPMAMHFHRFSYSGITANMLVVPLLSLAVPLGFLAVFSGWGAAGALAGLLVRFSQTVVDWHARWEPSWRVPDPPLWVAASLALGLIGVAVTRRSRARWRVATITVTAVSLFLLLRHPFPPRVQPGALEVTAIDVGQGDAFFIAFPDGKLMLLDAGGLAGQAPQRVRLDTGEDVIAPYLWSRSIRRLHAVAVSHAHHDHAGGLPAIIRDFRPQEIWTADAELGKRLAVGGRTPVRLIGAGGEFTYGGCRIQAFAPELGGRPASPDAASLVMRVCYGRRSFLFTGDMDPVSERRLAQSGKLPASDVLKAPHHGSRRSTTPELLAQLRPSVALISAGFENAYGHPHPDVLERLEKVRATALRTDAWGAITVRTDGSRLELDTASWQSWRRLQLGIF